MKFSAPVSDLQKVIGTVGTVIPARSTLPILENFLFDLTGNRLKVTATDLDTTMTMEIETKGMKDGKIGVPAKRIMETVRALSAAALTFTADLSSNKISILTENGEYKLTGESHENFPSIPEVQKDSEFKIGDDVLRRLIGNTVFAVSSDELRPAMTGVFLQMNQTELRAVATDGHRLVRIINSSIDFGQVKRDIIVPARAMQAVVKSMSEDVGRIALDDKHALFTFNGTSITSRLIEEKYPNYESVIPGDNDKELVVNTNEIIASLRRTSIYASSATHQVRLSLSKDSLVVSAEDADFGSEAKETIKCSYKKEPMEIGFNSAYLLDVLGHVGSEEASILLSNPTRAIIIKPFRQREGENMLMLVMPVRLSS